MSQEATEIRNMLKRSSSCCSLYPWWTTSVVQKAGLPLSQVREEQMSGLRLVVPASTRQPSSSRQQALLVTLIYKSKEFSDCKQEQELTSRVPVTESVPESVIDEVVMQVVVSVVSQGSFVGVLKP